MDHEALRDVSWTNFVKITVSNVSREGMDIRESLSIVQRRELNYTARTALTAEVAANQKA